MNSGEYVRMFNDLTAAVSDSKKEDARYFAARITRKIIDDQDFEKFTRLVDDMLVAWYDTYKGKGPWLPREVAGIKRQREGIK